ncbi:MAG: hypothetical protein J5485_04875, partial [Candidatus Methanomethylophilaceae archaeon]|nr:hypothetical protein [Candidatus Methanomethylophilaceae archaeon]
MLNAAVIAYGILVGEIPPVLDEPPKPEAYMGKLGKLQMERVAGDIRSGSVDMSKSPIEVFQKAFDEDPAKRYKTAGEIAGDLKRVRIKPPGSKTTKPGDKDQTVLKKVESWVSTHKAAVVAVSVATLLTVAAVAVVLSQDRGGGGSSDDSMIPVHFRVASDSTGLGNVSTAAGEAADIMVPYGTTVTISGGKVVLSDGSSSTPKVAEKAGYTVIFSNWSGKDSEYSTPSTVITGETWFWAHFDKEINEFPVHFRVASDSTGLGYVSTAAGELADYRVPYGTTVSIGSGGKIVLSNGINSTPKAIEKAGYDVAFTQWNGADDLTAPTVSVITGETWFWAHFVEEINTFPVHFRVASDSIGLGNVSTAVGELTDYYSV